MEIPEAEHAGKDSYILLFIVALFTLEKLEAT